MRENGERGKTLGKRDESDVFAQTDLSDQNINELWSGNTDPKASINFEVYEANDLGGLLNRDTAVFDSVVKHKGSQKTDNRTS